MSEYPCHAGQRHRWRVVRAMQGNTVVRLWCLNNCGYAPARGSVEWGAAVDSAS